MTIDRRRFLQQLGAGAALALPLSRIACSPADVSDTVVWDATSLSANASVFSLGLQVGAVRAESALFWGYASDGNAKRLRVWEDLGAGEVRLLIDEDVDGVEGYLKVAVDALPAGTPLRYAWFSTDDVGELTDRSDVAAFTTAFAEGSLEPLVVATTACTRWLHMPYEALQRTAEHDFHVFCHLGDWGYNDHPDELFDDLTVALTQEDYRRMWQVSVGETGYRQVLQKAGLYVTLDDHEVDDNFTSDIVDPDRMAAALEAWFETCATPRLADNRFWDSYRWGDTAEIFVLDLRTTRTIKEESGPRRIMAADQMDWLKTAIAASPCHFKIVMSSVPITSFPEKVGTPSANWVGFPDQRAELLDWIVDEDIRNVWFLAGEMHMGVVGRVERDGPRHRIREVLVGPGGPLGPHPAPATAALLPEEADEMFPPAQFEYYSSFHAATLLTFDPEADTVHVLFLDKETGEVLYEGTHSETS